MTFSISLSPQNEARLKERAAAQGTDPTAYASQLLEDMLGKQTNERVAVHATQAATDDGMGDAELDRLL